MLFSCLSSTTISVPQSFTNGAGFYLAAGKEVVSDMRKIVLKDKETGEFIDNFSSTKGKGIVSVATKAFCEPTIYFFNFVLVLCGLIITTVMN